MSSGVGALGPRTEWKFNMSLDGNHTRELVTKGIQNKALMDALTITAGGLSGGISSAIAGGKFWDGATQGAIVAGLNHLGNHSKIFKNSRNNLGEKAEQQVINIEKQIKELFESNKLKVGEMYNSDALNKFFPENKVSSYIKPKLRIRENTKFKILIFNI